MSAGFLGTAAPASADLVLLLEVVIGIGLLLGAVLARKKRYRAHAWCQSSIVLLNAVLIAVAMIPSFHERVQPKIPEKLDRSFYALATAHATLGSLAEAAGLYVALAAGTSFLPERLRLTNYKVWMRSVLILLLLRAMVAPSSLASALMKCSSLRTPRHWFDTRKVSCTWTMVNWRCSRRTVIKPRCSMAGPPQKLH